MNELLCRIVLWLLVIIHVCVAATIHIRGDSGGIAFGLNGDTTIVRSGANQLTSNGEIHAPNLFATSCGGGSVNVCQLQDELKQTARDTKFNAGQGWGRAPVFTGHLLDGTNTADNFGVGTAMSYDGVWVAISAVQADEVSIFKRHKSTEAVTLHQTLSVVGMAGRHFGSAVEFHPTKHELVVVNASGLAELNFFVLDTATGQWAHDQMADTTGTSHTPAGCVDCNCGSGGHGRIRFNPTNHDEIALGCHGHDLPFNWEGIVYVFQKAAGVWSAVQSLQPTTSATIDFSQLGSGVGIYGNRLIAGAHASTISGLSNAGAVATWERADASSPFVEVVSAELFDPTNVFGNARWGVSVWLGNDELIVGTHNGWSEGCTISNCHQPGYLQMFTWNSSTLSWDLAYSVAGGQHSPSVSYWKNHDWFGRSFDVAPGGNRLIVSQLMPQAMVHIFERDPDDPFSQWTQVHFFDVGHGHVNNNYSWGWGSVRISDDGLLSFSAYANAAGQLVLFPRNGIAATA